MAWLTVSGVVTLIGCFIAVFVKAYQVGRSDERANYQAELDQLRTRLREANQKNGELDFQRDRRIREINEADSDPLEKWKEYWGPHDPPK